MASRALHPRARLIIASAGLMQATGSWVGRSRPGEITGVGVQKLSPRDFFRQVLGEVDELTVGQRDQILAAADEPRSRVEALEAVLREIARA
jgi:hypothetical protein